MKQSEIAKLIEVLNETTFQHAHLEIDGDVLDFDRNQKKEAAKKITAQLFVYKSPMVGIYHAPRDHRLAEGQLIHQGDLLGQLESMKLFNYLISPVDGILTTICVNDEETVEFDQPLFKINERN